MNASGVARLDFGYPWWLTNGHLVLLAIAIALLLLAYARKWSKWTVAIFALLAFWSCASYLVVHNALNVNARAALPTEKFLSSGVGRVLDLGAGTGRSSIMVLQSRPQASLVALDLFGESFDHHFGHTATPQERLQANLRAAGVDQRTTISTSDMRKLPFESATFEAVVSSYAVDHLNREGVKLTLGEAFRVVKPGGDLLLMVLSNDRWLKFAFGPLLVHSSTRGPSWWTDRVKEAGFKITEQGLPPGTLYILARR